MGDTNYSIVTDRNYEKDNTITIESKSTTGFTGVWVGADPSVFYSTFVIYHQHLQKLLRLQVLEILLRKFFQWHIAYVNLNNYNSGEANVRRGINISWSEYDTPSANKHVFTFDTPMADSNYAVVTDRPYENDNCVHIYNQSTTGFTAEWDYDNPEVFGGILIVYASTPTKTIGGSSSSTEILPVAFRYVHMGNYDAGVNDRKGINISWSEYDSSAQEHVFTFDTPMGDSNYVVVTDRSDYEDTNAIYIKYKSTTGFTAEWVGADPDVFSGSFIV